MHVFRDHIIVRCIWLFLAVQVFNISIDMPDRISNDSFASSAANDMESIAEWLIEQGLNMEDAVPEQQDPDNDEERCTSLKDVWYHTHSCSHAGIYEADPFPGLFAYLFGYRLSASYDILKPPPDNYIL